MTSPRLIAKIGAALQKAEQRRALLNTTNRFILQRSAALSEIPNVSEALEEVRRIKEVAITHLEENMDILRASVEAKGGRFFFAKTAEEAVQYVLKVARSTRAKSVVKSKSLTTEEIGLNEALEKEGIEVVETDLGERIVQLAHEKPSHFLAPAIHHDRQSIARLFSEAFHRPVEGEISALTAVARETLRDSFLRADIGITGVNVAVAETGSIVVIENEGNARLVAATPRIHIAIMGAEKVVRSFDEAMAVGDIIPKSATGQRITSYVNIISGHVKGKDEAREFHLVVVDNGRSRMREDPRFRDALYCVRCSACLNVCPTYRVVGGHVFGHIYPGPIGLPWTAYAHGLDEAYEIAPLCISCGLCKNTCPVDIDIPFQIATIKKRGNELHGNPTLNKILGNYESLVRLASQTAPLANWFLRISISRRIMQALVGIDCRRPMPNFTRKTFSKWFAARSGLKSPRKVAYFVDTYAEYSKPEIGKAVVHVLEQNGYEVQLPSQKGAGMPLILYGELEAAEKIASFNLKSLAPFAERAIPIVASEPTAAYMFREIYPKLAPGQNAKIVAENSHDISAFLVNEMRIGNLDSAFSGKLFGSAAYHWPCHGRSLASERPVVHLLEEAGLEVHTVDHGCCGMAGTYGFRKGLEGYELSMAVGEPLFKELRNPGFELIASDSSVCKMHIEHGTSRRVFHPITLIEAAYASAGSTSNTQRLS